MRPGPKGVVAASGTSVSAWRTFRTALSSSMCQGNRPVLSIHKPKVNTDQTYVYTANNCRCMYTYYIYTHTCACKANLTIHQAQRSSGLGKSARMVLSADVFLPLNNANSMGKAKRMMGLKPHNRATMKTQQKL